MDFDEHPILSALGGLGVIGLLAFLLYGNLKKQERLDQEAAVDQALSERISGRLEFYSRDERSQDENSRRLLHQILDSELSALGLKTSSERIRSMTAQQKFQLRQTAISERQTAVAKCNQEMPNDRCQLMVEVWNCLRTKVCTPAAREAMIDYATAELEEEYREEMAGEDRGPY